MSADAREFLIVVVGALLILGVVIEVTKMIMRHKEGGNQHRKR